MIGEMTADGQFDIVWQTDGPIRAEAWSPHIPDSASKIADWTYPWVCGNCTEPTFTPVVRGPSGGSVGGGSMSAPH